VTSIVLLDSVVPSTDQGMIPARNVIEAQFIIHGE